MLFGGSHHTNYLGPDTRWSGHLSARSDIDLSTPFEGSVHTTGHVVVRTGCRVEADISAESLTIEQGALYRGRLQVGRELRTET
jgi:cytoskeletal protein CcmA (bactofilin family)